MTKTEQRAYQKGVRDTQKAVVLWCKDMERIHRRLAKSPGCGASGVSRYLFAAEAMKSLQSDIKLGFLHRGEK